MSPHLEIPAGFSSPNAVETRLSVVFAARGRFSNIRKTLECLLGQSAVSKIEFILTSDSPDLLHEAEEFVSSRALFAKTVFLSHPEKDLAGARLHAAARATSDLLAFAEDHCFQEPNWAAELLAAFDSSDDILAAAPLIRNPNPASAVSRAQFVLSHGILEPVQITNSIEPCDKLPWHSTVYRTRIFVAAASEPGLLQAESFLQEKIGSTRDRPRFVRCTRSTVFHVNMTKLWPALRHSFHGGRIFGSERALRRRWGRRMRTLRSLLFFPVALLKVGRCAPLLVDRKSPARTVANFFAALPMGLSHALGEAVGASFGKGRSAESYARFECDRADFLCPSDRAHLDSINESLPEHRSPALGEASCFGICP